MQALGIVGLILAILILIIGAYKSWGALPITLIAGSVAVLFNLPQMEVGFWTGLTQPYMAGYAGTYSGYFLIFIFSALYARMMNIAKAPIAIGYKLIDWFGAKNAVLVSIIITAVLTYGGVSLFVVIFAVTPINYTLYKEADIPRHILLGTGTVASATFTMTSLPGTPQLTNIIPTQYLGTTMTAAPVLGIICSAALFILGFIYCQKAAKNAQARGEHFTFPAHYDPTSINITREELPSAGKSFVPIIILIIIIVIGSNVRIDGQAINSAMLTVIAMLIAAIICVLIFLPRYKGISWTKEITGGMGDGISAIGGLAAVVAFGTVVQNTPEFQAIVKWVLSVDMGTYFKGIFSTAVISGITGSSSGGLRIMYGAMADYFVNSGCNLSILHRLTSIAAGSLDTLPHASGLFLTFQFYGLQHKDGYRHIFWTSVFIPLVVCLVATAIVTAMGM
ncbi:MAG: GntP family permease [Lachnospiraceae bacterium]|nr:GntP family permease [Lachnospiraceae bacterium]